IEANVGLVAAGDAVHDEPEAHVAAATLRRAALDIAHLVHGAVVFDHVSFLDVVGFHRKTGLGWDRNTGSGGRGHFGASRTAPSSRMVSPLRERLPRMYCTRSADTSAPPSRAGKGIEADSDFCTSSGIPSTIGVQKMPGATVLTRMPKRASSRAIGRVMATTPPLEAE